MWMSMIVGLTFTKPCFYQALTQIIMNTQINYRLALNNVYVMCCSAKSLTSHSFT